MRTHALILVILTLPLSARAETVGFNYSFTLDGGTYTTTWGPGPIFLDAKVVGGGTGFTINNGSTVSNFSVKPGGGTASGPDPITGGFTATISLGNVSFGTGPGGAAFKYGFATEFTGKLHVWDTASGLGADVPVKLSVSGLIDPSGNQYGYSIVGPPFPGVHIGQHDYTTGFAPLSISLAGGDLLANVFVDWSVPAGGPAPINTPEPTSFLLAGLGLVTLGRAVGHTRRHL